MGERETLLALADRAEAATGPDRELDATIASIMRLEKVPDWAKNWSGEWQAREDGSVVMIQANGKLGPHFMARTYTASLDAAMTLVPDGWIITIEGPFPTGWEVGLRFPYDDNDPVQAATPALALTAAALRARAATLPPADMLLTNGNDGGGEVSEEATEKSCADIARAFIDKHRVTCPEATAEDGIYEEAPLLVEALAEAVGYHVYPDDEA